MTAEDLRAHIQAYCPLDHVFRVEGLSEYTEAFITAFLRVHEGFSDAVCVRIFDHKFNKGGKNFQPESYLQSASELSVAHHIRSGEVSKFAIEQQVNADNGTDVDVCYTRLSIDVRVEVKCATEEIQSPEKERLIVKTAGRIPNRESTIQALNQKFAEAKQPTHVIEGKNKDNTLKQYLVESARKFPPTERCSFESLSVLFVACDCYDNIGRWRSYLFGEGGLFTSSSFQDPSTYQNVDVVILSNLKYRHRLVRLPSDWTLENVFILPFVNPRSGRNILPSIVKTGLSIFDHHLARFGAYKPSTDDSTVPDFVLDVVAVEHYVNEGLTREERSRLFPIIGEGFSAKTVDSQ